jgi:Peptidase A4 family
MSSPDKPFFDEAKFRRALPFEVVPTKIPGAYDIPPPPPGFDPRTATSEERRRAGIFWRRSVANRNPIARGLWESATAHRYTFTSKGEGPPPNVVLPHRRPRLPNEANTTWAGVVLATGSWTGVIGSWVVPTLSKPSEPPKTNSGFTGWWMSTWVGLDGYQPLNSNDILQIGIYQNIDTKGNASAWAWYEWWLANPPSNAPVYVNAQPIPFSTFQVNPGDTLVACASYVSGTAGSVTLLNQSQSTANFFHKILAPPPTADFNGRSAEWILEVPGGGEGYYSLPAFSPLTFTGALACNCASDLASATFADPSTATLLNLETASDVVLTNTTAGDGTSTINFVG